MTRIIILNMKARRISEANGSHAFAHATSTPVVDLGTGGAAVGTDLPSLVGGETYRFRIVARNTSPKDPVVDGEEQVLTVPVVPVAPEGGGGGCPNEALRTGLSAQLPDCRAYEQLTPVDKEGSQEIFNYGGGYTQEAAIAEDGDQVMYNSIVVKYGAGPGAGQSPYVFARGAAGWGLTAVTAQPEAGVYTYTPQAFSRDLSQFALSVDYGTGTGPSGAAPKIEFKAGPPGGPYTTVAAVPRGGRRSRPGYRWDSGLGCVL